MAIDKLTSDLIHLEIAISDAKWELQGIRGHSLLKECIEIAEEYLEEVKEDIYGNEGRVENERSE